MYKHVVVVAAALSEELEHTYKYLSSCYEIDETSQKHLSRMSISPYGEKSTHFLAGTNTDNGFCSPRDIATPPPHPQCSAFKIDTDNLCLLLVTGYGSKAVQDTVAPIYNYFMPTRIYFAGCALGLSEGIAKNTVVQIMETIQVDNTLGTQRPTDAFEHRLSKFDAYHNTVLHERGDTSSPLLGVALCGDLFINVIKRRSSTSFLPDNIASMLPDSARPYFKIIMDYNNTHTHTIPTVFDMESAALVQCVSTHLAPQESLSAHVLIMRVVLDTIFDTHKINFRKDIAHISKIIFEWMCRHAKL